MDRRSFVVGTAAAAAALATGSRGAGRLSLARGDVHQSVPAGRCRRRGGATACGVLEPILKQPVVIETKAGAAGQVGAQFAASATPDGYTLLMHIVSISGFAEVDKLFGRPVKFTRDDFIPIARFIADPMVLVVNDQQPYKSLKEFVDDAKKRPNELIFSSSGLYGALHLPTALFMKAAGIDETPPDQRRRPGAHRDPRQQQPGAGILDRGRQRTDEGRQAQGARLLRRQRAPALPDVPTMKELGYNVEFYLWVGMFAPKGTPAPSSRAARGGQEGGGRREVRRGHEEPGPGRGHLDQAEFKAFWDADAARVEDAVRQIGKV